MQIRGSCHCGNISYTLFWSPDPAAIPARACRCSFCRKHGGVWTSCPTGRLEVHVQAADAVTRYRFGTATADFHVCTRCGVVPLVTSDIGGSDFAVVNVNTLEGINPALLVPGDVDFDGEATGDRLARRARGWIPQVVIHNG